MNPLQERQQRMTWRQWLSPLRGCLGAAALAALDGGTLAQRVAPRIGQGIAGLPHFKPRATRVISLLMAGRGRVISTSSMTNRRWRNLAGSNCRSRFDMASV